jgi:hypothetical protein
MKTTPIQYIVLIPIILWYSASGSAQNLVINGDFEDYNECPQFLDNINNANNCLNFGGTCDYYNTCLNSEGYAFAPNTPFGYQQPLNGNGYAGLSNIELNSSYREFLGIELEMPLVIGTNYFISFYATPAFREMNSIALFSNNLGIKGIESSIQDSIDLMNGIDIVHSETIISDTIIWQQIKGSFIADQSYDYLVIGNFQTNDLTSWLQEYSFQNISYHFIDGIRLSVDSVYAWEPLDLDDSNYIPWQFIHEFGSDKVILNCQETNTFFAVYDVFGNVYNQGNIGLESFEYKTSGLSQGIYLFTVRNLNGSKIKTYKFTRT